MLLIYLQAITNRSEYVFDLICKTELGIEYKVTTDSKVFKEYTDEKLNYSSNRIGEELFINASSLLFETQIIKTEIPVEQKHGTTVLFPNGTTCDTGFDIFAAVFYMVSRYEEYLPFIPDEHGRFKATNSLACQNNFLQYPIVNIWINYFKNILHKKFPSLQFRSSSFKAVITYDIDIAYAFKGRTFLRTMGSTVKDILAFRFKNISERINSAAGSKDPWDVYDFLEKTIKKNNLNTIFFFLMGDYSRYDKNIKYDHPLMSALINKVAAFSDIGIHPSYRSSAIPEKILIEKSRLEKIAGKQIIKSRQHYLRFNLPDTYNQLLASGITEEYSMGFADMPGFRAGTCSPFYFYDLKNERATGLKIFPVTFMEGTFLYYLRSKPKESLDVIFSLINEVDKVDGTFISIWHNDTVSDFGICRGWKWVHDEMIKRISVS